MLSVPRTAALQLLVDGSARPIHSYDFILSIDGLAIDDAEHWAVAAVPGVSAMVQVRAGPCFVTAQLPPAPLGLSQGSPEDAEAFALYFIDELTAVTGDRSARPVALEPVVVEPLGALEWRLQLAGQLPDGRLVALSLEGGPSVLRAMTTAGAGRESALSLCRLVAPGLDLTQGRLSELSIGDEGDEYLSLTWMNPNTTPPPSMPSLMPPSPARRPLDEGLAAEATDAEPLCVGARRFAIQSAALTLLVKCERLDQARLELDFEVTVDEHSGEDGALAPTLCFRTRAVPFEFPAVGALCELRAPGAAVEAWFGNDAPELDENAFSFRLLPSGEVWVDWRAVTHDLAPFRFAGRARFERLFLDAAPDLSVEAALGAVFGSAATSRFEPGTPEESDGALRRTPLRLRG